MYRMKIVYYMCCFFLLFCFVFLLSFPAFLLFGEQHNNAAVEETTHVSALSLTLHLPKVPKFSTDPLTNLEPFRNRCEA